MGCYIPYFAGYIKDSIFKGVIPISKFIVKYSPELCGDVNVSGSKNSALPIMAACIMIGGIVRLENIPDISDIHNMSKILTELGCRCTFEGDVMEIDSSLVYKTETEYEITSKLRASFLVAGPLLARFRQARISLPGGCSIGQRPVDLHIRGFESLGAKSENGSGYVEISAGDLKGAEIYLDFPSVGATQNIIMASCFAKGVTMIENAAAEPEIKDLCNFLNLCGAKIEGAGTDVVKIEGVRSLFGTSYKIISDRIEAGTFMAATAVTNGNILLKNVNSAHLKPVVSKLGEMGVEFSEEVGAIRVNARGILKGASLRTMPFPGFPTDMQSQFAALMCKSQGVSSITETIFENRFMYAGELLRMNGKIRIDGRTAHIEGVDRLCGAKVSASDLRGGAALVIAGLGAEGITEIENAHYIRRGYDNLEMKLRNIGADIYTE